MNPVAGTCECLWAGAVTGERNCSLWLLSYKVQDWEEAHTAPEGSFIKEAWLEMAHYVFSAVMICSNFCKPHRPVVRYYCCPHFIEEAPERFHDCLRQHWKQWEELGT